MRALGDFIFIKDLETAIIDNRDTLMMVQGRNILITGSTGLIGSSIIKMLLLFNEKYDGTVHIIAYARNSSKAEELYGAYHEKITWIYGDIVHPILYDGAIDYIFHCASVTASKEFVSNPVETIDIALCGTKNILDLAKEKQVESMIYLSSMEVYGSNISSVDKTAEDTLGFVDPLAVRSCYPEGKRMCECLCGAYAYEYQVPVKIARLAQTFGAGVNYQSENRVFAQFAKSIISGENIELRTKGESWGNYCYITDALSGLFTLLMKGSNGQSYNIANENSTCQIKEVAYMVAQRFGKGNIDVIFNIPLDLNQSGYAPDTTLKLNTHKLQKLGWSPKVGLEESYRRLIDSFRCYLNQLET